MRIFIKILIIFIFIHVFYLNSLLHVIYPTFPIEKIECVLHSFGVNNYVQRVKMARSIFYSSKQYKIDPYLIIALIYTESRFNPTVVSRKGYKGLMQTPQTTKFVDVDITYGCSILNEKMKIAKGNLLKALTLYKGGNNNVAKNQASHVLTIYYHIKNIF